MAARSGFLDLRFLHPKQTHLVLDLFQVEGVVGRPVISTVDGWAGGLLQVVVDPYF